MKFLRRLRALFRREKLDAEMFEEMRLHVEMQTERNIAAGMTPDEARYAALRQFGNVAGIQEQARDGRGWVWLELIGQDLRQAGRALRKSPGFTLLSALSLGLGIGVSTTVFGLIEAMLLRPVPSANPVELVQFGWVQGPAGGKPRQYDANLGPDAQVFSPAMLARLQSVPTLLADACAVAGLWATNVSIDGQAEVVAEGELVSGNFHEFLGVGAYRGRILRREDDAPGAAPVCVISHHYWKTRFHGAEDVIGKTMLVNQLAVTIVGVTPSAFRGVMLVGAGADITLPLELAQFLRRDRSMISQPDYWWLHLLGRRHREVTLQQLEAGLQSTFQDVAALDWENGRARDTPRLTVTGGVHLHTVATDIRKRLLLPLAAMAALALLASCANVGNLLLARGSSRRREFAVRMALGATRGRLIRQLNTESLLLATLGTGFGLLFSHWNLSLLSGVSSKPMAGSGYVAWLDVDRVQMSQPVFLFAGTVILLTGLVVGLVPAFRSTGLNLSEEFQGGMHSHGSRGLSRLSQMLIVAQVAISTVLLTGSALCVQSLRNLHDVDLGFRREQLLLFATDAQSAGYGAEESAGLAQKIADRLSSLPGVRSVGYSSWPVLTGEGGPSVKALAMPDGARKGETVICNAVGPGFFETYEMPFHSGRSMGLHDVGTRVAVVNEAFADKYFGNVDPVGRHVLVDGPREIIGVVADAKLITEDLKSSTSPMVFIPFAQGGTSIARFVVRTETEPERMAGMIRQAVGEVDPHLPIMGLSSQAQHIEWRFFDERLFGSVAGFVGFLATALVGLGLYGLIAYTVSRRTAEIGVRMALGAQRGYILRMVLAESFSIVLVGLVAGIGGASALLQMAGTMFFGIEPTDPATYGMVAAFLTAVAMLASWLPARRAARVDPMVALRAE